MDLLHKTPPAISLRDLIAILKFLALDVREEIGAANAINAHSGNRAYLGNIDFKPLLARSGGRIARHSAIRLHQVSRPSGIFSFKP